MINCINLYRCLAPLGGLNSCAFCIDVSKNSSSVGRIQTVKCWLSQQLVAATLNICAKRKCLASTDWLEAHTSEITPTEKKKRDRPLNQRGCRS